MYDLVIIGAGPAGMSAAVYAARYKMKVAMIGMFPGGYVNEAHLVENWLGDISISGGELSARFLKHVKSLDIDINTHGVKGVIKTKEGFDIVTDKDNLKAKRIIIALGTERNKLGIKGEDEFLGKGVSYCTTCDAFFFRGKTVAVIGGSDSACTGSLMLSDIAEKVYLIYRQGELRAEPAWVEEVKKNKNIEVILNANPLEVVGDTKVTGLKLDNGDTLSLDGVFVEIGTTPGAAIIGQLGLATDEKGYVVVDDNQKTNVDGVWAAGDITTKNGKLKQIIVAASEGAVATYSVFLAKKSEK
ncbi:MAG: FAD-dependent oxidoreductase [bacterium]